MKLAGYRVIGSTPSVRLADRKVVDRWTLPTCRVVKLSAYVDGLGGSPGVGLMRAVLYDVAGNLLAMGDEVAIPAGRAAAWVDFTFSAYKGGVPVSGDTDLGLITGGDTNVITWFYDDLGVAAQRNGTNDTYSDGASNPFGVPTVTDARLFSWFATYVNDWTARGDLYDRAQLPLAEAQVALAALSNPQPVARASARSGWHGNKLDDGQASFAVVDSGGPLADLVGRVVKVSLDQTITAREVWAFCHASYALDPGDDLSLSRRLFLALAPLNTESVPVTVEVIA